MLVITLLAYGCLIQAIVAAYRFDERTIKDWWQRAGEHCQQVHGHWVGQSRLDLGQVQAGEIKVKMQGRAIWMALAMMVSTRLWLGDAISAHRDKDLIQRLANQIRTVALCRPLLLAVDGLSSYVGAFQRAFRTKLPRWGHTGRARLRPWSEIAIVQVVKQRRAGPTPSPIVRRTTNAGAGDAPAIHLPASGDQALAASVAGRLSALPGLRQHLRPLD